MIHKGPTVLEMDSWNTLGHKTGETCSGMWGKDSMWDFVGLEMLMPLVDLSFMLSCQHVEL